MARQPPGDQQRADRDVTVRLGELRVHERRDHHVGELGPHEDADRVACGRSPPSPPHPSRRCSRRSPAPTRPRSSMAPASAPRRTPSRRRARSCGAPSRRARHPRAVTTGATGTAPLPSSVPWSGRRSWPRPSCRTRQGEPVAREALRTQHLAPLEHRHRLASAQPRRPRRARRPMANAAVAKASARASERVTTVTDSAPRAGPPPHRVEHVVAALVGARRRDRGVAQLERRAQRVAAQRVAYADPPRSAAQRARRRPRRS